MIVILMIALPICIVGGLMIWVEKTGESAKRNEPYDWRGE